MEVLPPALDSTSESPCIFDGATRLNDIFFLYLTLFGIWGQALSDSEFFLLLFILEDMPIEVGGYGSCHPSMCTFEEGWEVAEVLDRYI
ncbi:uncharacterized protein LOC113348878 isoform X3 [Papaver somniferum]|nr:uncharacterized protein LOC113348878 isoform X3 [Papaver somniferum]